MCSWIDLGHHGRPEWSESCAQDEPDGTESNSLKKRIRSSRELGQLSFSMQLFLPFFSSVFYLAGPLDSFPVCWVSRKQGLSVGVHKEVVATYRMRTKKVGPRSTPRRTLNDVSSKAAARQFFSK